MVLGLRSKHKRDAISVKVDYIVTVQEIRPWPPSDLLRRVSRVILQWANGNKNSGSFLSDAAEDSNGVGFNDSFKLPVILHRDKKSHNEFQRNYLEFSLFEPRKDNKAKGQLLGTALVNLAEYGVIEDVVSISAIINLKKNSNSSVQPFLVIDLEPVERAGSNSSPSVGVSKEPSLNNDDDVSEIASFTDDDNDVSPDSASSYSEERQRENARTDPYQSNDVQPSVTDASSDTANHVDQYVSSSNFYVRSSTSVRKNRDTSLVRSSTSSSIGFQDRNGNSDLRRAIFIQEHLSAEYQEVIASRSSKIPLTETIAVDSYQENVERSNSVDSHQSAANQEDELKPDTVLLNGESERSLKKLPEDYSANETSTSMIMTEAVEEHDPVIGGRFHSGLHNEVETPNYFSSAVAEENEKKNVSVNGLSSGATEEKEARTNMVSECKNEWRTRIEMLEDELREAAAIEVALYTVAAEHSSSANKVHAPARRLSRFYGIACKSGSQTKRARAARTAVSGLVLVSKACGNDVPRLTFWLSNLIMLRSLITQTASEFQNSNGIKRIGNGAEPELTLMQSEHYYSNKESDDKEDVQTFITALEKVESWLFSRIVESLWWQTFTPHMQPSVVKQSINTSAESTKKSYGRRASLSNQEQGDFSIDLWKKAFKDACEKLCPIRAVGHECGCLSVLVRLVMEQLVDRLDVAMFNAILRESDEEMPTDPLSDPISDSKVLPIPAGKASFGAGVELKNAIGYWSRHLTDLFGIEDESTDRAEAFRAFRLLHALSDLMMIPFGMLADVPTRKDVSPSFGPMIVKRVLSNFVPDEFCPKPVPRAIIDSLDTEVSSDDSEYLLTALPYTATAPTTYSPPSAALLVCVGEVGSQVLKSSRLSSLKKSYTSDDELDELDSPLTSIFPESLQSSSALGRLAEKGGGANVVRYRLLREIWKDDD